ncbi:hypothetical protein [Dactylosporangium sp. NPDC049140]|uniref:hypothetical protein n=1 Tax=Dactylosporangium sp. NPDC049140 TaxID=3155647 RepID=UPI003405BC7E
MTAAFFRETPPLQLRAVEAIERAIAVDETRMRVLLAPGSGKSAVVAHIGMRFTAHATST